MTLPTRTREKPTTYARAVAGWVAKRPAERAAEVFDSARSRQRREAGLGEGDDWLADSEEQRGEEDATWEAALARQSGEFEARRAAARAEIAAGTTQPVFDAQGNLQLP